MARKNKAAAAAAAAEEKVPVMTETELRDNAKVAYDAARHAYERLTTGRKPQKKVLEDTKLQSGLRAAVDALRDVDASLAEPPSRRAARRASKAANSAGEKAKGAAKAVEHAVEHAAETVAARADAAATEAGKAARRGRKKAAKATKNVTKQKSGGAGRKLLVLLVGGGLALALSDGLRSKVLDALFGAEEEFDYTSTTNSAAAAPAPSAA